MKVRILDPGFLGYTGIFGRFNFTDGVSDELSQADAEYLGCVIRVEIVGGDQEGQNPSVTQQMVDRRELEMKEVMTTSPQAEQEAREAAERAQKQAKLLADVKAGLNKKAEEQKAKAEAGKIDPATLDYTYTKEDLSKLVSKGGIAELRAFAEPYGVKGTSVAKLVAAMLELKDVYDKPVVETAAPEPTEAEEAEEGDDDVVVDTGAATDAPVDEPTQAADAPVDASADTSELDAELADVLKEE